MNKFTANIPTVETSTVYLKNDGGRTIGIQNAEAIFKGTYSRHGADLKIVGPDGTTIVIIDYFAGDAPPGLMSSNGALLTGDVVSALAGPAMPGQYAQATDAGAAQAGAIGAVISLTGTATAQRADGTVVTLKIGDPVFESDVVATGDNGTLGLKFADDTVFSISANARMTLDSFIYDPAGNSNSMFFNLVDGVFTFVAGKVAPTGNMQVETPVATMGIRGTTPQVTVSAADGSATFSILPDPVCVERDDDDNGVECTVGE
ncbi:MAG: FecR family protein, partial [Hyphomicrobiaceae bacterium]